MDDCMTGVLINISAENSADKTALEKYHNGFLSLASQNSCDDDTFFSSCAKPLVSIENVPTRNGISPACGKLIEIDSSVDSLQQSKSKTELPVSSNSELHLSSEGASLLDLENFDFDLLESPASTEPSESRNMSETKSTSKEMKPPSPIGMSEMIEVFKEAAAISTRLKDGQPVTEATSSSIQSPRRSSFRLNTISGISPIVLQPQSIELKTSVCKIGECGDKDHGIEDAAPEHESSLRRTGTFRITKSGASPVGDAAAKLNSARQPIKTKLPNSAMPRKLIGTTKRTPMHDKVTSKISAAWKNNSLNSIKAPKTFTPIKNSSSGRAQVKTRTSVEKDTRATKPRTLSLTTSSDLIKTRGCPSSSSKAGQNASKYGHVSSRIKLQGRSSLLSTSSCKPNSSASFSGGSYSSDVFLSQSCRDTTNSKLLPRKFNASQQQRSQSSSTKPDDGSKKNATKLRTFSVKSTSGIPTKGPMKAFTPVCRMVKPSSVGEYEFSTPPIAQPVRRNFGSIPSPGSFSQFKISEPLAVSTPNIERSFSLKIPRKSVSGTPVASPAIPRLSRRQTLSSSGSSTTVPMSPRKSRLKPPSSAKLS